MLKILFRHKLRIAVVIVLVLLLACVRAFENILFYDPFLKRSRIIDPVRGGKIGL